MQQPKSKSIDVKMCARVSWAFDRLNMTYDAIARDAGIPSKANLIETKNAIIEPSKKIIRYLCRKGFSGHWIITGRGSPYYADRGMSKSERAALERLLAAECAGIEKTMQECGKKLDELRSAVKEIKCR